MSCIEAGRSIGGVEARIRQQAIAAGPFDWDSVCHPSHSVTIESIGIQAPFFKLVYMAYRN